jgi:two-component system NtrC family sensor kinase
MSQTRAILVVSQQAVEVQAIIQTNMIQQGLVIDVLDSDSQLFKQLTQYPRALLIIDLALVPTIASFFMQIEIKSPNTAVILLVTEDERGQAIEYLQQGAADYLLRPIDPTELTFKINRILEFQALKHNSIAIENARLFQDLSSAYIDLAQSREKILRSQNTLRVVFDGITDGLYILDQDLTINALNRIEAERQGYEPGELIGKSYLSLNWAQTTPELLNQIKESLRTGKKTTWISSKNESEPYLKDREFRIYPIHDRLGQIEQVLVFAQDVSERRRWQASLFRSANLAAVGQLAGSVAHQINNPLTVTMTNSQLLLIETEPDNEAHDLAAGILKASERIQNIVANLLEFSNQEQYFFVQTSLIDTIDGALALVIRSLKKAKIRIVKEYQAQPMLSASVSHLKLVWVNLLLNARDAIIDYADQPLITISTKTISYRQVKVTITDNGIGLREGDFEQLFRPFFTTKPVGKALGLGLYSAQAIIERHHGQIRAFSQPGDETTFEVILPLDNPRDL